MCATILFIGHFAIQLIRYCYCSYIINTIGQTGIDKRIDRKIDIQE